MKSELFNDLHPEKSLKNTGFKNKATAINTIKLVQNRSLRYQFDVINTMYNRAKYHPNKTPDMDKAMEVFTKWLSKYKSEKDKEDKKYPWLPLDVVNKYRTLNINNKINEDFIIMYKKVNGKAHRLQYIPVEKNKPEDFDYWSYRIYIINKILDKIKSTNKPLYKKNGLPTKLHLTLILHAYSPDIKKYYIV